MAIKTYKNERDKAARNYSAGHGEHWRLPSFLDYCEGHDYGYRKGLEAASEHLLRLAERTDAGNTQGIGVALVRAAREIMELGKGEL